MAAKMTSLKMSAKEAKSESGMDACSPSSTKDNLPRYPYGTKVRLETEALDKLGLDHSDYSKGQVLILTAKVEVVGISTSQRQGGKDRNDLELQITDMSLDQDKAAKKAKSEAARLNEVGSPTGDSYEE